jgi:hypothetical protein
MKSIARYWSRLPAAEILGSRVAGRNGSITDKRFEGFLHSMAVAINGNAGGLSFPVAIIPDPPQEDIDYHEERGEQHAPAFARENDITLDGTFQYDTRLGPSRPGEPGGRPHTQQEIDACIAGLSTNNE